MERNNVTDLPFEGKQGNDMTNWEDVDYWQFADGPVCSILNATQKERQQMLVNDLLIYHFEYSGEFVQLDKLFRFFPNQFSAAAALNTLLSTLQEYGSLIEDNPQRGIRLCHDREILQKAMDFTGVWWKGFEPPEGEEILCATEHAQEMVELMGLDGMAEYLAGTLSGEVPVFSGQGILKG